MSSADLLQCLPPNSNNGEVAETLPQDTSSAGLPSSPSVSVSSSDSPSQTSPSSACGSSSSDRRNHHENELLESGDKTQTLVKKEEPEQQQVPVVQTDESVASTSASPMKGVQQQVQNAPPQYQVLQHQQFYPSKSYPPQQPPNQPQRLTNATRPRRLRLSRTYAHRVVGAGSNNPQPRSAVNGGDISSVFNPVALDFSPSSNTSSPLTGYGAPIPMAVNPMQPYPMLTGLVYQPQPVHLMVEQQQQGQQQENGGETGGDGGISSSKEGTENAAPDSGDAAAAPAALMQHVVQVHVNPGVIFNVRVGDDVHHITGPATVPMVSPSGPPHPLPLQVPPGHVVQQVIDEHGTLRHIILSLQQGPPHAVYGPGNPMDGGEYLAAPMTSSSSPSHGGLVNGGTVTSSGSGGSRTNTPPSPQNHPLSGASTTFQPSQPPPMPPFALYHTLPPPFMLPPHLAMPPGPPMPGHYPAVSPVSLAPMPMDGGQYPQSTSASTSATSSRGYFQPSRSYRANSQPKEDGSHVPDDSTNVDDSNAVAMYEMPQSSPVILVNGNGAPIIVHDGATYEMPPMTNGAYHPGPPLDQFSANIQQRKANFGGLNGGGPRRWRKQMPSGGNNTTNNNNNNTNLPSLRQPRQNSQEMEPAHNTDGGGDDSSSSGSGHAPISPSRPRGHSMDSSIKQKFQAKEIITQPDPPVTSNNGNNSAEQEQPGDNNGGEQAAEPELSEEELERRRLAEAIGAALSQLGPPKLINVTATSLTVEMAPLPIEAVVSATALTEQSDIATARQNIVYDVALSVPQRENQLDNIYTGQAAEVNVVDLKPATHYTLGVSAIYTGPPFASSSKPVRGIQLPLLNFQTQPAAPEKPDPPKLAAKNAVKASSMNLRWSTPPSENGSPVNSYLLEWKQGPSMSDPKSVGQTTFSELFRCAAEVKTYRLTNLQPATLYSFRLAAVNALGQSPFSDEVSYRTSGAPPPAPEAPQLRQAAVSSLTLNWPATVGGAVSLSPMEFILQMDDLISGHGFLPVYKGADTTEYMIRNLRRNSEYRFRLAAENDDGQSKWSEPVVTYRTLPDAPRPPARLTVKSAAAKTATSLSAHSIRLCWEAPRDDGGTQIDSYEVQVIEAGPEQAEVQPILVSTPGTEREVLIDNLHPGRAYRCRVRAKGVGGTSDWSDVVIAGTAATCPGTCSAPPTLTGRAKPTSLAIRWSVPSSDGGATISGYEVRVAKVLNSKLVSPAVLAANDLDEWQVVYEGADLTCVVHNLAPGRSYVFQVRALNRVGPGLWNPSIPTSSPATLLTTAPAPPDAPMPPFLSPTSAHVVAISWQEPNSNGARITEYRLEESSESSSSTFLLIYSGSQLSYEATKLQPATQYSFRLQALNAAGPSPYSPVVSCQTPPAPPAAPTEINARPLSSDSFALEWLAPHDNGSPIVAYTINLTPGDRLIHVPLLPPSPTPSPTMLEDEETQQKAPHPVESDSQHAIEHIVDELLPDTVYRVRVQAVNQLGAGVFSAAVKVTTPPLPPQPPEIELVEATHNILRLRWVAVPPAHQAAPGTDLVEYTVFMDRPNVSSRLQTVYTGSGLSCSVKRLQERTQYRFLIQAKTQSGGTGPLSQSPRTFSTLPNPPPVPANLVVTGSNNDSNGLSVSWRAINGQQSTLPIEYVLQWTTPLSSSFVQLYRGHETTFAIPAGQLPASGPYSLRVAAAVVLNGEEFALSKCQMGQFCPANSFRINKVTLDQVQLLPAVLEKTDKTSSSLTGVSASSSSSSSSKSATAGAEHSAESASNSVAAFIIRLLEAVHLRRRSDDESWTDTQLAAGFVAVFALLSVGLSYVAHLFLSATT